MNINFETSTKKVIMASVDKSYIKIFSGNSNVGLADNIARELNLKLGDIEVSKFSDGETSVVINETVRDVNCFIVQSTCSPVNDNLMELLVIADALKRACAKKITAIIPYFGYARQDRKVNKCDPITAKLVADLITISGVDEIITMDLHVKQIEGFFNIPVTNLEGLYTLAENLKREIKNISEYVVVSPDLGSVNRVKKFAKELGDLKMAIINKFRPKPNECEVSNIFGDVKNKDTIILDDMIDTAGTLCKAADFLLIEGAKSVTACATHGVFSGNAFDKLEKSNFKNIYILDTIPLNLERLKKLNNLANKVKVFSTSKPFADLIKENTGMG